MQRITRKSLAASVTAMALGLGAGPVLAAAPAMVTTNADSGPGSLRDALASGATQVRIGPAVNNIMINSALVYDGTAPLRIIGNNTVVRASGDFNVLELTQGASLWAGNLTLVGPGGFEFGNDGTGKGLFIQVPNERTGTVNVNLFNVTVRDVANHGIHVSDCTLGDDCGAGSGGGGDGSPASINMTLQGVTVYNAGNGKFDADGVRVDERADGDINFTALGSRFLNAGADGVELDEGNDGDVWINVRLSRFNDNGAYCLPAPLDLAEPCVEDDDGELVLDLDDAFDVDEAGNGGVYGTIALSTVRGNLDEGLDFDEEGDGGMDVDVFGLDGFQNGDEAVKLSSAGAGDVYSELRGVVILENGNDGAEFETEDGDGEVHIKVGGSFIADNDSEGIAAAQENATDLGTIMIRKSFVDELDLENVVEN